jgi:hypothetical protein
MLSRMLFEFEYSEYRNEATSSRAIIGLPKDNATPPTFLLPGSLAFDWYSTVG